MTCGHVLRRLQAQGRVFRRGLVQTSLPTRPIVQIYRWALSAEWQSKEWVIENVDYWLLMKTIMVSMIIIIFWNVWRKQAEGMQLKCEMFPGECSVFNPRLLQGPSFC